MSGIVGIVNLDGQPVDTRLLRRLTDFIAYRGPDAQECLYEGAVGFGHTMLRTTFEAENEHQPCTIDGQVWITADARIDGRAELIADLVSKGCRIAGIPTDAELILHAYAVWGPACAQHLLGDFAFAIWDGREQRLFCARDHFGIKPFYYANVAGSLLFSNTLNCLRAHPLVSDELNDLAIADFLMFGFNQDRGVSYFKDIQRLAPAHSLVWTMDDGLAVRCYWQIPVEPTLSWKHHGEVLERFHELFWQAVSDRLRARDTVVMMSGGVDSTSVAAVAHQILSEKGEPFSLHAVNVVLKREVQDDESPFARLVCDALGIPLHIVTDEDTDLSNDLIAPYRQMPGPIAPARRDFSIIISRLAASFGRVLLTGYGGDPVFYPSQSYVSHLMSEWRYGQLIDNFGNYALRYRRLPPLYLRSQFQSRRNTRAIPGNFPVWLSTDLVQRHQLEARWEAIQQEYAHPQHLARPEAWRNLNTPYWQDMFETLLNISHFSQAIEQRHPFFDIRLIEFLLRLSPWPWFIDKFIIREAMKGYLPEAVRTLPKHLRLAQPVRQLDQKSQLDKGLISNYIDDARYAKLAVQPTRLKAGEAWLIERPVLLAQWIQRLQSNITV